MKYTYFFHFTSEIKAIFNKKSFEYPLFISQDIMHRTDQRSKILTNKSNVSTGRFHGSSSDAKAKLMMQRKTNPGLQQQYYDYKS